MSHAWVKRYEFKACQVTFFGCGRISLQGVAQTPLMPRRLRQTMLIRAEEPKDWAAVHAVNQSTFETPAEAGALNRDWPRT